MPNTCPCCGQAVDVRQFPFVDLGTNTITWNGETKKSFGIVVEIYASLLERAPNTVTVSTLISKVWGLGETGENSDRTLAVHVSKLRGLLKDWGFSVDNTYAKGYRLVRTADLTNTRIAHPRNTGRPPKKAAVQEAAHV